MIRCCRRTSDLLPLLLSPSEYSARRGLTLNSERAPVITTAAWYENHSPPLKAALPSEPPLLCTCPLTRSLTSFASAAAAVLQNTRLCVKMPFQARKRRIRYALFWLISEKMSAILFRLFVCSFVLSSTCLIVRTKRIVELMNVLCCYYLLACACMDLLFLCLGGKRDGGTEALV